MKTCSTIVKIAMNPIIIQPKLRWSKNDLKELFSFRFVLIMLIIRDVKLRYKQTALGMIWVIVQPLMTATLLTLVFGNWLQVSSDGVPYMIFSFCGLIPWLVFSQSVQRASSSLVNEMQLVQKIYFPRLFLPLAGTLGVVLDLILTLLVFGLLMIAYSIPITWHILFLPIGILLTFLFSAAFNIFFSILSAYYRDFKHIVPFTLQFWMYATPLAYSISSIPEKWRFVFSLNPLTGIVELFRWSLLGTPEFPRLSFCMTSCITCLFLAISLIVFRKLEERLADVL